MKIRIKLIAVVILFLVSCHKSEEIDQIHEMVDYRESGNFTTIKDQKNLGACWAFACAGLTEYHIKKKFGTEIDLSEQHLINCAGFGPSEGLNYLKENGITTEDKLPYQAQVQACNQNTEAAYKIENFEMIKLDGLSFDKRIEILQTQLKNYGPFITHFDLYVDFDLYTSGVYEYDGTSKSNYGHIVVVAGFADNPSVKNGGYWICRNSWGSQWGENGYFKIPYDECNIATAYAYTIADVVKTE